MNLRGKHILITGCSRGLGRELVSQCCRARAASIWATVRVKDSADSRKLASDFGHENVFVEQMDVTSSAQIHALASKVCRLDVLINNAGVCSPGSIFDDSIGDMRREFNVNYFGVVRVVRAFRSKLIDSKGVVVNVASQLFRTAMPALANYSASKSAMVAASQAMRAELKVDGISVCVVCPSGFVSEMSSPFEGPKHAVDKTASDVLDSLNEDDRMVPIGPEAEALFELYSRDPVAAEKSKYDLTFEKLWGSKLSTKPDTVIEE